MSDSGEKVPETTVWTTEQPWNLWRKAYTHSWTICHGHAAVARVIGTSDTADTYARELVHAINSHNALLIQRDALAAALKTARIELRGIGIGSSKAFHRIGIDSAVGIIDAALAKASP